MYYSVKQDSVNYTGFLLPTCLLGLQNAKLKKNVKIMQIDIIAVNDCSYTEVYV